MHKFNPLDHTAHLADILAQLYRVEDMVCAGDREALVRLVMEMDWHSIADEFELVVASHYYVVERYAHRVSYNLQRPYLLLQDCKTLEQHMQALELAIDESPSLLNGADATVARAWQRELEKANIRHRPVREMPPIHTLHELRVAVAQKLELGHAMEGKDGALDSGQRVAYEDLNLGRNVAFLPK